MRFKIKIVTRYMIGEFIPTFIICFLFFLIIYIINHMLLNIKPLFEKNIPIDLIFRMFITAFPLFIIISLPFGTLLATLMTMGRFSSDNEIVAFRSLGFNIMQIFSPIIIAGVIITLFAFYVADRLYPIGEKERKKTMYKIMNIKPTLEFKSKTVKYYYEFGKTIFTDTVNDTSIEGLIIIDRDTNNQKRIISAKKADIYSPKDRKGVLALKMDDAMVQFENRDRPGEFNFGYSDNISYFIKLQEFGDEDDLNKRINEKNTVELYKDIQQYKEVFKEDLKQINDEYYKYYYEIEEYKDTADMALRNRYNYSRYLSNIKRIDNNINDIADFTEQEIRNNSLERNKLEFYRKFAQAISCLIFVIFGAPIGVYSRRAGYAIGFVVGLFLCAVYWFSFYATWVLGRKYILPPFYAMFIPNIVFLAVGIFFLIKRLRE